LENEEIAKYLERIQKLEEKKGMQMLDLEI
jgi:hypothetical protein